MHERDSRTEDLLAEELTSEEVRELLERLNVRDMGGSENPTVGTIVEATGSSPAEVGRLLGEIRKEDFEERFGLRLDHHEKRIETLEERTRRIEKRPASSQPSSHLRREPTLDHYQQVALDRLAEQERQREALKPVAYVIAAIVVLVLIVVTLTSGESPKGTSPMRTQVGIATHDGTVYMKANGESWVELSKGGRRKPTPEEEGRVASILYSN